MDKTRMADRAFILVTALSSIPKAFLASLAKARPWSHTPNSMWRFLTARK